MGVLWFLYDSVTGVPLPLNWLPKRDESRQLVFTSVVTQDRFPTGPPATVGRSWGMNEDLLVHDFLDFLLIPTNITEGSYGKIWKNPRDDPQHPTPSSK